MITGRKLRYTTNPLDVYRMLTREVKVGDLKIGGQNPIRLQSMTSTSSLDVEATVKQIEKIIQAGGELVRMAIANKKEAALLLEIREKIREKGYKTPLVADTHFNPEVAILAAQTLEKVRINPGNFISSRKNAYSDEEYTNELIETEQKLTPLIRACRENDTAMRIGSNHGSLSPRIIYRYGDTPQGMVQSAMEYVKICIKHDFYNLVLSMKSSNTRVMVQAYRLLMHEMLKTGEVFPLHLGVTEAGAGEDGRIKSAVGIGALLLDGLGDTIRVSLTEAPEKEIPVANELAKLAYGNVSGNIHSPAQLPFHPFEYHKRAVNQKLLSAEGHEITIFSNHPAYGDYFVKEGKVFDPSGNNTGLQAIEKTDAELTALKTKDIPEPGVVLIMHYTSVGQSRAAFNRLDKLQINYPVILYLSAERMPVDSFSVYAASVAGQFFIDGLPDGIWLSDPNRDLGQLLELSQNILQASRARTFKTEFISCPGCGRTLFDLQETSQHIKKALSHLKGLKIAVMGCIVNGPGEMADADYGYVGAAKGKITLYKKKEIMKRNIPEDQALDELVSLIKENGDWIEQESS